MNFNQFLKDLAGAVGSVLLFFFVYVPLLISSSLPHWLILMLILLGAFVTAFLITYLNCKERK